MTSRDPTIVPEAPVGLREPDGREEIFRATIFQTPTDPFADPHALHAIEDGALLVRRGRIAACDAFVHVRAQAPDAACHDWRGGALLPGLIDAHVHFPQVRIAGHLGLSLLDWLERVALPEEARLHDPAYAAAVAHELVRALAVSGTTTALVFGAHFPAAMRALFDAADTAGLRIVSGLCVSDRFLRPDLLTTPEQAYRDSRSLIHEYHGRGRLRYAVTPRFALSTSEAMLEMCQSLGREHEGLRVQTHINENRHEIAEVRRAFPWADDYLGVYDRYGLAGHGSVLAHNVWPTDGELERLARSQAYVAHCPCSNAALGSGIFPLGRHLAAGVGCALGTDVGAGTGFGMLKEALQAHLLQRVAPEPVTLDPAQLLFLATRGGARALGLDDQVGDFSTGKAADFVYVRPAPDTAFAAALARTESLPQMLATIIAHAREDSIAEVRVAGSVVHSA